MSQKLTSEFSAERNGCSDDVRSKEPANGVKNKNKPKCVNCLRHLCNAGKVNHGTHKDMTENGFNRTHCLFTCGCIMFVEYREGMVIKG